MDAVILIFSIGTLFSFSVPIYLYFEKLKSQIRTANAKNILLLLGQQERLSYKRIAQLLDIYRATKVLEPKSDAELVSIIVPRVVMDIKGMTSYEQLRLYLSACPIPKDNPLLAVIHRQVSIICNGKFAELVGYEVERIKNIEDPGRRAIDINGLIAELESESFKYFYFQKPLKITAEKIKANIKVVVKQPETSKVVSIETFTGHKTAEG